MSSRSLDVHDPDQRASRRSCLKWAAASLAAAAGPRWALGEGGCPCATGDGAPQAAAAPPATRPASPATVLRVCADPHNLPFSSREGEGFEDKIAALVARDLGLDLEYRWLPQRLGFFREALKTGDSQLVMGAPDGFERALTTDPYYRSSYVFVSRKDKGPGFRSLDDPALKSAKIGVQLTGGANTPPAIALGRRNLIDNVTGYPVFDESDGKPSEKIIAAVASGEIDVALVWGPPAGYFAKRQKVPLVVTPVSPQDDPPGLTFAFDICMAVRRSEKALRDRINPVIARRRADIDKILDDFGVPHFPIPPRPAGGKREKDDDRKPGK